jgi:TRAP-type transport system periplasmic protein
MAFLVIGLTPYRFPDSALLELPGLFDSAREGTLVYTRLIAGKALHGYDDFVVLGAYTAEPNVIHSRKPTKSLDDLKGQKIRANNPIEADALAALGATPTVLEMPKTAQAIQAGAVDGTSLSPTGMIEFGIARVAPYHYLLRVGSAPFVLVMSRKRFAGLPQPVQALIGKYSGNWTAARWASTYEIAERQFLAQLRADPNQYVVTPTPGDLDKARRVYQEVNEAWAANSPGNRGLLRVLRKELAAVRSGD